MRNEGNVFEGLEDLGFQDVVDLDLYKKPEEEIVDDKEEEARRQEKIEALLYDKRLNCPVCNHITFVRAVKTNGYRLRKKDSDFYAHYDLINPYYYDVWVCNICGYAAMKSDFDKIKKDQITLVQSKITPKWKAKIYPKFNDIKLAVERYKLALLNYAIINARSSQKAMTCLKLSWMYRELKDENNEALFREHALTGFMDAYEHESFPFYGMDKYTVLYLIGDLNRRKGDFDNALLYFSKVITAPGAERKIKDLARDRRDDIREEQKQSEITEQTCLDNIESSEEEDLHSDNNAKAGFLKKLFKSR